MDALGLLAQGAAALFVPATFAILIAGVILGLLVAVLPGLTLVMGVVLALPFTYGMGITGAVVLLTSMYVAGTYGGAFTSILFRIPGEPLDVPLLWDGYAMSKAGNAALALGWTLVAALGGGLVAAVAMVAMAEPVARVALSLSTPEYFAIVFFGLASVVCLGGTSLPKAVISLCLGLMIATVGSDPTYGVDRFAFGIPALSDGIDYLAVMVGAYGLGEVLSRLEQGTEGGGSHRMARLRTEMPKWVEIVKIRYTFVRSAVLGFVVGLVPGAGATIASFLSYGVESQYGKRRKEMGSGLPEGIVAPQTAATASVGGAMVPLLTLGIPGSGATAIIMGAFLLHGVQPGPQVFASNGVLVYTIFASVFFALIAMCVVGFFAIKLLVRVLDFPEALVSAFVVMFCFMGALALRNNPDDLWLIAAFGVVGFVFERFKFPIAPMVLGAILGPIAETNFMTTMISFGGDWTVFFTRPISGPIMALGFATLAYPIYVAMREKRVAREA